jgi:alpha-tubulin suppressor-like RCC1 family protein
VWGWGNNALGGLGDGTWCTTQGCAVSVPTRVSSVTGAVDVAATGVGGIALTGGGTVWVWGNCSLGQLGNGTPVGIATTPVEVPGLGPVSAIDAEDLGIHALVP